MTNREDLIKEVGRIYDALDGIDAELYDLNKDLSFQKEAIKHIVKLLEAEQNDGK